MRSKPRLRVRIAKLEGEVRQRDARIAELELLVEQVSGRDLAYITSLETQLLAANETLFAFESGTADRSGCAEKDARIKQLESTLVTVGLAHDRDMGTLQAELDATRDRLMMFSRETVGSPASECATHEGLHKTIADMTAEVRALRGQLAAARRGPLDFPAQPQPHRVSDDLLATGWGARSSADAGGET